MEIETRFGTQSISPDQIITFPGGIPGFPSLTQFKLFRETDDGRLFLLQSVEDPDVSFPVVEPGELRVRYELLLSDADLEIIQSNQADDVVVLILLYRTDQHPSHTEGAQPMVNGNLLGPLVINVEKRLGMQKVLTDFEQYVTIRTS